MSRLTLALCLLLAATSLPAAPTAPQENDCWGSDKACSDGKYRDSQGKEQPASCNNYKTTDETHQCHCNMAETCPEVDEQGKQMRRVEDSKCQVYCRHDACKCISPCDT